MSINKNITVKIPPLACGECRQTVESTLGRLQGVASVTLNHQPDQPLEINVSYQSGEMSFEKIREALGDLGYPIRGYIIHEHEHTHDGVTHSHEHGH